MRLGSGSTSRGRSSASGASASFRSGSTGCAISREAAGLAGFPPKLVVEIKALACELPAELGLPLSRLSCADVAREAVTRGIVAAISGATVWRWLSADAIKPWLYRSWISPRDPQFAAIAGRVVDLYQGFWEGKPLAKNDYVSQLHKSGAMSVRRVVEPSGWAGGLAQAG